MAAVLIAVLMFGWLIYTARRASNALPDFIRKAKQRLWNQGWLLERPGIRTLCLKALEASKGSILAGSCRMVTGILVWLVVPAALIVAEIVLLVDSDANLSSTPIVDVISSGVLVAGFFFAAWLGIQAVFFKKLSGGPIPKELAARVCSLDTNDFCKWVGDLYSEAIEANGEVLSERDSLLKLATLGVGLEVLALAMMGFCSLWGC